MPKPGQKVTGAATNNGSNQSTKTIAEAVTPAMPLSKAATEVNGITLLQPNTHGSLAQANLERAQQIEKAELAKCQKERRRLLALPGALPGEGCF